MNNVLTKTVVQILMNNEDSRDDLLLTIRLIHDGEMAQWGYTKEQYYDALFGEKLSSVHTIGRIWRLAQEKKPELRGKLWEERQKQAGLLAQEFASVSTPTIKSQISMF